MSGTQLLVRLTHIVFGTAVLMLFWIPISTRKGGRTHRGGGRLYVWAGRVVIASALVSSTWGLVDPTARIGSGDLERDFDGAINRLRLLYSVLGVLATIALAEMERGVFIIRRPTVSAERTWMMVVATVAGVSASALGGWGLVAVLTGNFWHGVVRIGVAILGLHVASRTFTVGRVASPTQGERQIAHLDAMLGSAGAFYTAFAAFGFRGLVGNEYLGGGPIAVLPWIAPTLLAIALAAWWKRRITKRAPTAPVVANSTARSSRLRAGAEAESRANM